MLATVTKVIPQLIYKYTVKGANIIHKTKGAGLPQVIMFPLINISDDKYFENCAKVRVSNNIRVYQSIGMHFISL